MVDLLGYNNDDLGVDQDGEGSTDEGEFSVIGWLAVVAFLFGLRLVWEFME